MGKNKDRDPGRIRNTNKTREVACKCRENRENKKGGRVKRKKPIKEMEGRYRQTK